MGKGGDKSASKASDKGSKEVLIEGRLYDVTNFMKRHPGGSVINFFDGSDATQAFEEFHTRSKKARKVLKGLPNRAPEEKRQSIANSPLIKEFNALRSQLEKVQSAEKSI